MRDAGVPHRAVATALDLAIGFGIARLAGRLTIRGHLPGTTVIT
jgi:hypothetical protein